jgi:predicted Zn finger-like uncharacterized protein
MADLRLLSPAHDAAQTRGYTGVMDVKCPHCGASFNVVESEHYKLIACPKCAKEFQAFSARTEKLSRDFLSQVLKPKPGTKSK